MPQRARTACDHGAMSEPAAPEAPSREIKGVLFDFGGVITTSPFDNFAAYEAANGLPNGLIRRINSTNPDSNAWAQLERSSVTAEGFCELFEAEALAVGHEVSGAAVMDCLSTELRPFMVRALELIHHAPGLCTAMLTNNFAAHRETGESEGEPVGSGEVSSGVSFASVVGSFDHVLESAVLGIRKPDPQIYRIACQTMGLAPEEIVFLDDLGINLKPARAMGMHTIKVVDPWDALAELEQVLGISLIENGGR